MREHFGPSLLVLGRRLLLRKERELRRPSCVSLLVPPWLSGLLGLQRPARRLQACPGLALEREGDDLAVALALGPGGGGRVYCRAGDSRSIGAEARHLERVAVIQPAAGWASHDGDAAEAAVLEGCEAPFVPDDSAMVTVHGLDIGVGLLQRRGLDLDHLLRQLWPVRVMALHISMSRSMVARAVMSSRVSRGVMRSIRASVS